MNQRLIWNFEFTPKKSLPLATYVDSKDDHIKWEARYFWQDNKPIILNTIDPSLLDITHYKQKHKEDYYYLLPEQNYNIKKRRNQLLYKPLLQKTDSAFGFGTKILLSTPQDSLHQTELTDPDLLKIMHQVTNESIEVPVKKEAFIYSFSTQPKIKMELARLDIFDKVYFSVCIEGRSLYLVETISKYLLEEQVSCEYVTFLKSLLKLC
ncbi:hypothetical protein Lgra_0882 [Legionella gratiana]|uniref:Uncharacterized protein n=1 Tax=Legionella gratiana TaxID=45066 RepID=A0A378JFS5_9GAMM|nr:hypothetical protein [Legionella gratiana]KTD13590.1 hypothetical protein Lgra_0882 [Legionella gratiana]STX46186.1 Uncharacterised protein [Legionella gratiana]